MFKVEKIFRFEAGHVLKYHDGRCKDPHGHSYILTVAVKSNKLIDNGPKKNMVIDFHDISRVVKPLISDSLDHKWLNETLNTDSPTAEYIAKWIYDYLKPKLPGLLSVTINETESARATYSEEN